MVVFFRPFVLFCFFLLFVKDLFLTTHTLKLTYSACLKAASSSSPVRPAKPLVSFFIYCNDVYLMFFLTDFDYFVRK